MGKIRGKKTLPAFGAHRGGCEVSTSAGSVAVGLKIKAALADEIACDFDNATHMPAARSGHNRLGRARGPMDFFQTA